METNYETWPVSRLVARIYDLEAVCEALKNATGRNAVLNVASILKVTVSEARVLVTLADGKARSHQQIFDGVYYDRFDVAPEMKIIDVFVCKLRKKLKPFGFQIQTVWGVGYQLSAPDDFAQLLHGDIPERIREIQLEGAVKAGPRQSGWNIEAVLSTLKTLIDADGYAKFTTRAIVHRSKIKGSLRPILNNLERKEIIRIKKRPARRDGRDEWLVLLRSTHR